MLLEHRQGYNLKSLLPYLKQDVSNCLYLYTDLVHYGLDQPHIRLWTEQDREPFGLIAMRYHDSFQLYGREYSSDNAESLTRMAAFLKEQNADRISGPKFLIQRLEPLLAENYTASYGAIFQIPKGSVPVEPILISSPAQFEEIPQIVDLLLTSEEFSRHYRREELIEQMRERYRTNMGRSWVIRDGNRIIGHKATFAETSDIAVISGAFLCREYRNTDLFARFSNEVNNQLCNIEHKELYFFFLKKRYIKTYSKLMGICASYGKMTKKSIQKG